MVVMKFGGTSVKDPEAIRRLARIVAREQAISGVPVVVVSAMSGITDQLLDAVAAVERGDAELASQKVTVMRDRHRAAAEALLTRADERDEVIDALERQWREAAALLHAMAVLREVSPRSRDAVVAMGELASSRLVAAALTELGTPARCVDARRVLVTSADHGQGQPDLAATAARLHEHVLPLTTSGVVAVLGGFIGATAEGITTTLGRGGSDYSASLFGAGLRAAEIQIWTDVDGMLTADPRVVEGARPLPSLSFAEASELAYFGAKVLHPSTIAPAVTDGIPVRILNSHRPEVAGTTITANPPLPEAPLTGLACKRDITVIDIRSTMMLAAYGFMRRVFEVFERYRTSVDVITTSEVSVSITIEDRRALDEIVRDLSAFAEVGVESEMALLCAVGERLRLEPGLAARVLGALDEFPLRMVSQAGARRNLTVVLPQSQLQAAMARVHERFCLAGRTGGSRGVMRAVLFGHGRMGRLVGLHAAEHGVEVVGVLTSASVDETWAAAAQASADVVIDFATGEALRGNLERLSTLAPTLVLGQHRLGRLRARGAGHRRAPRRRGRRGVELLGRRVPDGGGRPRRERGRRGAGRLRDVPARGPSLEEA